MACLVRLAVQRASGRAAFCHFILPSFSIRDNRTRSFRRPECVLHWNPSPPAAQGWGWLGQNTPRLPPPTSFPCVPVTARLQRALPQVCTEKGPDESKVLKLGVPGLREVGRVVLMAVMTPVLWSAASGVGSRLWFPVILLDGDGVALLLPGTAVRTGLSRHRWITFVCRRRNR